MVTAPSENARVRTVEFLELLGYTLLGDQVKPAVGVHTTRDEHNANVSDEAQDARPPDTASARDITHRSARSGTT